METITTILGDQLLEHFSIKREYLYEKMKWV